MRRTLIVLAVTASVAGCGSQQGTPQPSTPEQQSSSPIARVTAPAPSTGPVTDSTALAAAMITVQDLPAGFAAVELPPADLADPTTGAEQPDESSTDPAACADVLAPVVTQSAGATSSAAVAYSGPNFSSIDEDAASYAGDGGASTFVALQDTLAACGTFSGTDFDGIRADYRVSGLTTAPVGDASTGARVEIVSDGVTLTSDVVIAVVGSTVVQLTATAQEPMDSGVLDAVAAVAVDRLRGAGR